MPESRNNLAVPPVEMSSTSMPARLRANSTKPVLSVTLRMARWIFLRVGDIAGLECEREICLRRAAKFYQQLSTKVSAWTLILRQFTWKMELPSNSGGVNHFGKIGKGKTVAK